MKRAGLYRRAGNAFAFHSSRLGFSLIELVVVIAIIGLLATLSFTAVQSARESMRRTKCASNLHQLGIGMLHYEAAHQHFPNGSDKGGFSFLVAMLPYLERAPLESEIRALNDVAFKALPDVIPPLELLNCPSDPDASLASRSTPEITSLSAATSYQGNFGSGVLKYGYNGIFEHLSLTGEVVRGKVTDGLSNTAAMSEVLVGNADEADMLRMRWRTEEGVGDLDEFAASCLVPENLVAHDPWSKGRPWIVGDASYTMYNHVLPPNRPWCLNGSSVQQGAYPPSSNHLNAVNVLFADGHIDTVSDHIDTAAWRAIGSRAGD